MSDLLSPARAADRIASKIGGRWADAVCAEVAGERMHFDVSLRPGIDGGADVLRHGLDDWNTWRALWRSVDLSAAPGAGAWIESRSVSIQGNTVEAPKFLHVPGLAAATEVVARLGETRISVDLERARRIARSLLSGGGLVNPANLRAVYELADTDIAVVRLVLDWLAENPDASGWSARQVPVPGMHTKWLDKHKTLVRHLTGRDLDQELRKRPVVVHLTYVDPGYRERGGRSHDAWTTGDSHELAYAPHTVVVVENRDCRLFFPPTQGTVVVEGSGSAASALVTGISWVREADRVVYWGDMDAEGYAILDRFRTALPKVTSILMDHATMIRHQDQGVSKDKRGKPLGPSSNPLPMLTGAEREAYTTIATSGPARFRRIEQEKIGFEEALAALHSS